MNNFREVNEDILKEWLMFREDDLASLTCDEDRNHFVYFDEIRLIFPIVFVRSAFQTAEPPSAVGF